MGGFLAESRIGDHVYLVGHWVLPEQGVPRFKERTLWQLVKAWARGSGFEFERLCIFGYPPGEGRTFRFDPSGQIAWMDRTRAETPWK